MLFKMKLDIVVNIICREMFSYRIYDYFEKILKGSFTCNIFCYCFILHAKL